MSSQEFTSNIAYVFRRLPKNQFNSNNKSVRASAFSTPEGQSLSVFSSRLTPRMVLQAAINDKIEKIDAFDETERQKARDFLQIQGSTVEELVYRGWRVATITVIAFTNLGCVLDPEEPNGHINVWYPQNTSQLEIRAKLADQAILLDETECLREN